jgi:hypothetical protein
VGKWKIENRKQERETRNLEFHHWKSVKAGNKNKEVALIKIKT